MTERDQIEIRKHLVSLIGRRAASGEDAAAAARRAYEDLAFVLVPLISEPGFEALVARAFQLAQREYPSGEAPPGGNGKKREPEPLTTIELWLERQDEGKRIEASAAVFATVAALLATLIGETLTTRYLRKAWPDGFPASAPEGQEA